MVVPLRVTMKNTANTYVFPAIASAGTSLAADAPPMGIRLRLKASFDDSRLSAAARAVAAAMKKYGLILSGLGDDWAITGETSEDWPAGFIDELTTIPAGDFEVLAHGVPKGP